MLEDKLGEIYNNIINQQVFAPGIYVVSTPIGNLGDITFRALSVLYKSTVIACESISKARSLLKAYNIDTMSKRFIRLTTIDEKHRKKRVTYILNEAKIGIVSFIVDAGTPIISDPGRLLIFEAYKRGVPYYIIPGASSVITAVVADPFVHINGRFLFWGFAPKKMGKLLKILDRYYDLMEKDKISLVFFIGSRNLKDVVHTLCESINQHERLVLFIGKELTKLHEEFIMGTPCDVMRSLQARDLKGEFVMIISMVQ